MKSTISILYSGPKYKLDIRKFSYLMRNFEPAVKTTEKKEDFLKIRTNDKFQIGKNTGTLHFHNETLRHDSGEFSLNRIFSNGSEKSRKRPASAKKETSKKIQKRYDSECKKLFEQTRKVLNTTPISKRTPIKDLLSTKYNSVLQAKSRKYLNLSNIF